MVEPDVWEPPYLIETLKYLSDLSDDYHFIIARTNNPEELNQFKNSLIKGKKNILILLSDELGIDNVKDGPYFMQNEIYMIFRTYNNKKLYDENYIFPIPCGFSCGVGIHSENGKRNLISNFDFSNKPLKEREYDIFFSGQLNNHRKQCVEQINILSKTFKCFSKTTNSFAKGLSLNEYYDFMENSKIAFVPTGVVIPESFRFFEAVKSGCIVISTYPIQNELYKNWYYENSSVIFINSWSEVNESFVKNLLEVKNLDKYDNLNKKYFQDKISTEGLSIYIRNKVNEKI